MSARRIIVERPIAEAFTERLAKKTPALKLGRPEGARHDHRPADQREGRRDRQQRVDDAVAAGAKVLAGGAAVGACYQATLVADVPPDSELAQHETFGPVAAIEVVDSPEAAIARANATAYGLAAGILTTDADRGFPLAQQLQAGIVHVNDQPVHDEPQMPFGGVKDSGFGPLRRAGRGRRVHRAALDHRQSGSRIPSRSRWQTSSRSARRSRSSCTTATSSRSRASPT